MGSFFCKVNLLGRRETVVRFIHTADNHLGSPFKGLGKKDSQMAKKAKEASYRAFEVIIDRAIEEKVDFLIVAGDLYDTEFQHIQERVFVIKQFERLRQLQIPVFLVQGNHDFWQESALHMSFPDNTYVFGTSVETIYLTTKSNERIALTGFSYPRRWVSERMVNDFPNRESHVDVQIGIYHGFLDGSDKEAAAYAPFSIGEMQAKQYDYWALGHIHQRQVLSDDPLIVYPGNSQGFKRKELGVKGAYLVNLTPTKTTSNQNQIEFFETSPIIWLEEEVDLKGLVTFQELALAISTKISHLHLDEKRFFLLSLVLTNFDDLSQEVFHLLREEDSLIALQELIDSDKQLLYLYQIKLGPVQEQVFWPQQEQLEESFQDSKAYYQAPQYFQKALTDLMSNRDYANLRDSLPINQQFQEDVMGQVEILLNQSFHKGVDS